MYFQTFLFATFLTIKSCFSRGLMMARKPWLHFIWPNLVINTALGFTWFTVRSRLLELVNLIILKTKKRIKKWDDEVKWRLQSHSNCCPVFCSAVFALFLRERKKKLEIQADGKFRLVWRILASKLEEPGKLPWRHFPPNLQVRMPRLDLPLHAVHFRSLTTTKI